MNWSRGWGVISGAVFLTLLFVLTGCPAEIQSPAPRDKEPAQNPDPQSEVDRPQPGPGANPPNSSAAKPAESDPSEPNKERQPAVLVMDDGFDVSHPVFQGKLAAIYTLKCQGSSSAPAATAALSYEEKLAAAIEDLKRETVSCEIVNGIGLEKSPAFQEIVSLRDRWNSVIQSKGSGQESWDTDLWLRVTRIVDGLDENYEPEFSYHGTNTASVIAYQNPKATLILLQVELASSGEEIASSGGCPDLNEFAEENRILKEPSFQEAFINRPTLGVEKELDDIVEKHGVQVVNFSAGAPLHSTMVNLLRESGCVFDETEFLRLSVEHEKISHALSQERKKKHPEPANLLFVQSAGNSGARIDTVEDAARCLRDEQTLIVGSLNHQGRISDFSNYGDCVDFYILGESVVAAAPEGFLTSVSGTSFSAPLLSRLVAEQLTPFEDATKIKALLAARADSNRFLLKEAYPAELAFESSTPVNSFSLTPTPTRVGEFPLQKLKTIQKMRQILRLLGH